MATNTITENIVFGYASGGDSPAYSKNLTTNVVSAYLGSVNYTGSTGSWPISNAHGDNVGVTDVNATFVANPATDEYGRGVAPADRLGWLGAHYRFNIGGTQNLTRMGVRLYDPNLGRFLEVDPIEGGSANDYDYVAGDPVNGFDLTGTHKRKCGRWNVWCNAHNAKHKVGRAVDKAKRGVEAVARGTARAGQAGVDAVRSGAETVVRGASGAVKNGAGYANGAIECGLPFVTIAYDVADSLVLLAGGAAVGMETMGGSVLVVTPFIALNALDARSQYRSIPDACGFDRTPRG